MILEKCYELLYNFKELLIQQSEWEEVSDIEETLKELEDEIDIGD